MDAPALFDDRSASMSRVSGWERYSRALLEALGDRVERAHLTGDSTLDRFRTDWLDLPRRAARGRLIHYPTFPPTYTKKPFVWTLHDLVWWKYPEYSSRLGRHYYRRLAARALPHGVILTVSEAIRTELLEDLVGDPDRVIVAPNGVPELPPGQLHAPDRPYILTVGSVEPRKNLEKLGQAWDASGLALDHDLVICGRLAWSHQFPKVTVRSGLSDQELSDLYTNATALILPSIYEGFGLPVLEGLQAGLPVYCSDIPAFREVGGEHCNYFDPTSMDSIIEALRSAASPPRRPDAGDWVAGFTWKRTAEQALKAYEVARGLSDL